METKLIENQEDYYNTCVNQLYAEVLYGSKTISEFYKELKAIDEDYEKYQEEIKK